MRPRRAVTIVGAAVLAAGAAIAALALGQWPAGEAPSPLFEPRPDASADGSRAEGPSAADESGIAPPQQPRSIVAASPSDRSPQRTPLTRTPLARPRPARLQPPRLQPPRQPQPDGGPASQGKAAPPAAAHGTGAAQGTGATPTTPGGTAPPAAPGPGQGALPQSGAPDPVSPAAAPPALQPATVPPPAAVVPSAPVLTPPVPVDLSPPKHLLPYRMVVDAPGLAATARLEAVEARVRLRVTVRADGTVGRVEIAVPSGRPEMDAAALEAARQWRFLPARRNDEPIESVALIWVAFVVGP